MVLAVAEVLVAHTIDDNESSGVASAARFSRSVVSLCLLASFLTLCAAILHPFLPTFSIVAPLLLKCLAIRR